MTLIPNPAPEAARGGLPRGPRLRRAALLGCAAACASAACSSDNSELGSRRRTGEEPAALPDDFVGAGSTAVAPTAELGPIDPHALLGVNPAHGPFRGGGLAVVRGNGFSSAVRVWFGDVEVPRERLIATRADRVQVEVPAGAPGGVTLTTQNGDDTTTRRVLANGYHYDAFFALSDRGPTSGGSTLTLVGSGTRWTLETTVLLDTASCEVIAVRGDPGAEQELDCRLPPGSEGQKAISISTDGVTDTLLGGFTYEPGAVLEGGFGGAALAGDLRVHVTTPGGAPLAGAYVILGNDFDLDRLGQPGARVRQTDAAGSAPFLGEVAEPVTVTVAARCFQPLSFVAVPVDTLRAVLSPVASPDCADLQLPNFGGSPARPVTLAGELVWPGALEEGRAGWINVPAPDDPNELRAAYVFQPSADPENRFRLPRPDLAVTQASPGQAGYAFQLSTGSGSRSLYALAGVENRSVDPPRFTAYALGMLRGIYAAPGETIEGLAIRMDLTLDQAITLELEAPAPGPRGPDRLDVSAAVQTSDQGFLLLPNLSVDAPLGSFGAGAAPGSFGAGAALPGDGSLDLIGLPALARVLEGAQYAVSVRAVTGASGSLPQSVLPLITAREASQPIPVRSFVPVPVLNVGADALGRWDHTLAVSWTDFGRSVDLVHYAIGSGSGLITWTVVAPPSAPSVELPDLSRLPEGDLLPGGLQVVASLAGLTDFDYAALGLEHLRRFAWQAYSLDVATTRYER